MNTKQNVGINSIIQVSLSALVCVLLASLAAHGDDCEFDDLHVHGYAYIGQPGGTPPDVDLTVYGSTLLYSISNFVHMQDSTLDGTLDAGDDSNCTIDMSVQGQVDVDGTLTVDERMTMKRGLALSGNSTCADNFTVDDTLQGVNIIASFCCGKD